MARKLSRLTVGSILGAIAAMALLASSASAGFLADHLKCYKAKETAGPGKIQASADLLSSVGLAPELGCTIKGPPKLFCGPVGKFNVTPPAPAARRTP